MSAKKYPIVKTEKEWRMQLSDREYNVLREKGTEMAHTGVYTLHFNEGTYLCKGCDAPVFKSDHKFESHCGWPSFSDSIEAAIVYQKDTSHGMVRTEILCASCGGHLGHLFDDGPSETGLRYCVNSISMGFKSS